jgi:mono/diheme cytochrome c family protein
MVLAACRPTEEIQPTPTLPPQLALGQKVFSQNCGACHSTIPDMVIVGPSMAGIATHGANRVDGQDARTYIYTSIFSPEAYLVEGYDNLMPATFAKQLTGEELDAVVAYLLLLE